MFVKMRTNTKCFVVVGVNAFCGFVCWIQTLGATFGESNPPSFYVVLLMVFFVVALNFLLLLMVFLNFPW